MVVMSYLIFSAWISVILTDIYCNTNSLITMLPGERFSNVITFPKIKT